MFKCFVLIDVANIADYLISMFPKMYFNVPFLSLNMEKRGILLFSSFCDIQKTDTRNFEKGKNVNVQNLHISILGLRFIIP